MILTKRERTYAVIVAAGLGLFLLDRFALTPYWDADTRIAKDTAKATLQLQKQSLLFKNAPHVERGWRDMLAAGLKTNAPAAESQVLHALRDWSQSAGVELQSVKPERTAERGEFQEIRFSASGTGRTASVSRMLWSLETASFPLRLGEVRLTSRADGQDDLTFQFNVTALVYVGQVAQSNQQGQPAATTQVERPGTSASRPTTQGATQP